MSLYIFFERQCIQYFRHHVPAGSREVTKARWYQKIWFRICSKIEGRLRKRCSKSRKNSAATQIPESDIRS